MKVALTVLALLIIAATSFAQIDLMEPGSFGRLATFDESEDDRTWASIECNSAQIFETKEDPENNANMVGAITTTSCTDEGATLEQTFMPTDFALHGYISLDVYAPAADQKIALKIFNAGDPAMFKMVELMTT